MSPAALTHVVVCQRYDALVAECEAASRRGASDALKFSRAECKGRKQMMSFEACKPNTRSRMQLSAIIYSAASCVNVREELLAVQASLPMCKTAIVAWATVAARLLTLDFAAVSPRKTAVTS